MRLAKICDDNTALLCASGVVGPICTGISSLTSRIEFQVFQMLSTHISRCHTNLFFKKEHLLLATPNQAHATISLVDHCNSQVVFPLSLLLWLLQSSFKEMPQWSFKMQIRSYYSSCLKPSMAPMTRKKIQTPEDGGQSPVWPGPFLHLHPLLSFSCLLRCIRYPGFCLSCNYVKVAPTSGLLYLAWKALLIDFLQVGSWLKYHPFKEE